MKSTMMHLPLSTQIIQRHGASLHGDAEVVWFDAGRTTRRPFRDLAVDIARLAALLRAEGIRAGDRVATFCWNRPEHLMAYFAVPGIGAVLHTLNIRLFADHLAYIMNHAGDRALIVEADLLPLLDPVLPAVPSLELIIVIDPGDTPLPATPRTIAFDQGLAAHAPLDDWPALDEAAAAAVCYTSGTTGHPKGVVYSHKSIFVHTLASMGADTFAISRGDRILLLPPMFHANAWGLPFSAWFAGASLILPGPHPQPEPLRGLIEAERPTFTAMVPTLVNDMLASHRDRPLDMSSFRVIVSGGSAVSPDLIDRVRQAWDVPVLQGWGMTETSPLCALSHPPTDTAPERQTVWRAKSGRPVAGVEVRVVDDADGPLPHDGQTVGRLQVRGPWITRGYHGRDQADAITADGWLKTGDVGHIDGHGYVQITDRTKDAIKSGGEWISSVGLENAIAAHEDVQEVAVIGVPDPRWEERPLAIVECAAGRTVDPAQLQQFLRRRVAGFWVPEYWAFVDALPKTSVGKIDKQSLRRRLAEGGLIYARC